MYWSLSSQLNKKKYSHHVRKHSRDRQRLEIIMKQKKKTIRNKIVKKKRTGKKMFSTKGWNIKDINASQLREETWLSQSSARSRHPQRNFCFVVAICFQEEKIDNYKIPKMGEETRERICYSTSFCSTQMYTLFFYRLHCQYKEKIMPIFLFCFFFPQVAVTCQL